MTGQLCSAKSRRDAATSSATAALSTYSVCESAFSDKSRFCRICTIRSADVDALRGDARVEPVAVLGEQRASHQRRRVDLAVVGPGVDAVAVARGFEHTARSRVGERDASARLAVAVQQQDEAGAVFVVVAVAPFVAAAALG